MDGQTLADQIGSSSGREHVKKETCPRLIHFWPRCHCFASGNLKFKLTEKIRYYQILILKGEIFKFTCMLVLASYNAEVYFQLYNSVGVWVIFHSLISYRKQVFAFQNNAYRSTTHTCHVLYFSRIQCDKCAFLFLLPHFR